MRFVLILLMFIFVICVIRLIGFLVLFCWKLFVVLDIGCVRMEDGMCFFVEWFI